MAEDDIYGNKKRWENWVLEYINKKNILKKPENPKRLYYCKNKENFKYYVKLIRSFEVDDLSYIRRGRLKDVMNLLACHALNLDTAYKLVSIMGLSKLKWSSHMFLFYRLEV